MVTTVQCSYVIIQQSWRSSSLPMITDLTNGERPPFRNSSTYFLSKYFDMMDGVFFGTFFYVRRSLYFIFLGVAHAVNTGVLVRRWCVQYVQHSTCFSSHQPDQDMYATGELPIWWNLQSSLYWTTRIKPNKCIHSHPPRDTEYDDRQNYTLYNPPRQGQLKNIVANIRRHVHECHFFPVQNMNVTGRITPPSPCLKKEKKSDGWKKWLKRGNEKNYGVVGIHRSTSTTKTIYGLYTYTVLFFTLQHISLVTVPSPTRIQTAPIPRKKYRALTYKHDAYSPFQDNNTSVCQVWPLTSCIAPTWRHLYRSTEVTCVHVDPSVVDHICVSYGHMNKGRRRVFYRGKSTACTYFTVQRYPPHCVRRIVELRKDAFKTPQKKKTPTPDTISDVKHQQLPTVNDTLIVPSSQAVKTWSGLSFHCTMDRTAHLLPSPCLSDTCPSNILLTACRCLYDGMPTGRQSKAEKKYSTRERERERRGKRVEGGHTTLWPGATWALTALTRDYHCLYHSHVYYT